MAIPKKTIKKIQAISCMGSVLEQFKGSTGMVSGKVTLFTDAPPDFWTKDERELFDALSELETKIKNEVLNILTPKL